MCFLEQRKRASEQRYVKEAGKSFLSFMAEEEILQLVNLDTIRVHFSLCNQPICLSLCISSAHPTAGRCFPGTVVICICHGCSRQPKDKACSTTSPVPSALQAQQELWDSCGQQTNCDHHKWEDQAPAKALQEDSGWVSSPKCFTFSGVIFVMY